MAIQLRPHDKKPYSTGFPSPALPGSGVWGLISARFASTPNLGLSKIGLRQITIFFRDCKAVSRERRAASGSFHFFSCTATFSRTSVFLLHSNFLLAKPTFSRASVFLLAKPTFTRPSVFLLAKPTFSRASVYFKNLKNVP